jgi:beta-glucosidase
VRRILAQMQAFGLLACASAAGPLEGRALPPRPEPDVQGGNAVAQQVAEGGAVLLKNDGALPLTGPAAASIAVLGTPAASPVIGGGGSSQVTPSTLTNPLDSIRERAGGGATVTYAPGVDTIGAVVPGATGTGPGLSGGPIDRTGDAALPNGRNLEETRTLTVVTEGDYLLNLGVGQGLGSLSVDGVQVAGGFALASQLTHLRAVVHLTPGEHAIAIGAYGIPGFLGGPLQVRFSWVTPEAAGAALADAVELARAARVAVVFAYDDGTEGVDRPDLALPFGQDALVSAVAAANPDTVVVLNTGSSVTMPWLAEVRSVLEMYYPGQMGGPATARLLFGDVNPSGRLTQTFPVDEATTPVAGDPDRYPGVDGVQHYSEGILVGYRWYDEADRPALFPFGHGLSYTTFAYRDLDVRQSGGGLTATVTVENTGDRAGQEVVQVYVGPSPDVRDAQQAVRSLGGWTKVALQPGEARPVTVEVGRRQLEHWDAAAGGWAPGTGARTVWAGPSSRVLPLQATVTIEP